MSSFIGRVHDWKGSKWVDPVGWYSQDGAWKSSTRLVHETSDMLGDIGRKWGWNTDLQDWASGASQKDKNSIGRWGENTIGGIAAVLGAMYGASYLGGGEAGGGAGTAGVTGTDGAFLGEGVPSGIASWDAAYTGAGGTWAPGYSAGGESSGLSAAQRNAISKALGGMGQQRNAGSSYTYQPTRSTSGYQAPNGFIDTSGGR